MFDTETKRLKHPKYRKTTDVQQTWKEAGWTPPSEDPEVKAKWQFYRTLDTETTTKSSDEV